MNRVSDQQQLLLSFNAEITPRGDGSFIVKPGKPILGRRKVTVSEAAAYLKLSEDTIRRLYHAGLLEGERPSPRCIFIYADSIEAHLQAARDREFWENKEKKQVYLDTIYTAEAAEAAEPLDG